MTHSGRAAVQGWSALAGRRRPAYPGPSELHRFELAVRLRLGLSASCRPAHRHPTILTPAAALEATGTTTNPIHTDRINGRAVLQWSPKLDFTDQSMFYASYAVGSKAGNVNLVSGVAAAEGVPTSFKPEDLTSYEIGAKNTFLDGTLQANLTGWYYDYKNFQYTVVQYSTLFTQNFNAHMWGEEGEFIWPPTNTGSSI